MKIGFTGSREGMTARQLQGVNWWLQQKQPTEAHHGDCVGADAEFHFLCEELGIPVRGHPPTNPKLRAFCNFSLGLEPEKPYLNRNLDIVDAVDLMIGAPSGDEEDQPRSGTWYTIRYSLASGKPTITVYP